MEGGGRVSWMKYGPFVSLCVVLLALLFRSPQDAELDDRLDTVLSSLLRAERKVGMNSVARPRVAVGECKCCVATQCYPNITQILGARSDLSVNNQLASTSAVSQVALVLTC